MRALDFAGTVVWTPLAGMFWSAWRHGVSEWYDAGQPDAPDGTLVTFVLAIALSFAAAFCIARLFGVDL